MRHPLRILSIEDDPRDAELIQNLLETEDIVCEVTRVDTQTALQASLEQGGIDLILADYSLPSFDRLSALKLSMKACPDVPFIFVSGTLGEEVAIEALKIGATDYVLKTRLSRLVPSVIRALREAEERAERKQADEKLRRSEAYSAEAQRASHTGSFGWKVSSGEIFWSDETLRIFQCDSRTKPTVEFVLSRVHPEDRDLVQQQIDRAARDGQGFDFEYRLQLPDGSIKHLRVTAHSSQDSSSNLEFIGAVTDITERKIAEKKIRRLVDANILGIFIWNLEGAIVGANEAFLRMVQYGREDLLSGRVRWTDLTPAEWRERDERAVTELKGTGTVQPYEKEYFRKDGTRVPVLVGSALFQEGGNEGVAFVLDLSEQKRAEEALRTSEAYLAEAQRLTHTASWVWRVAGGAALHLSEEWYRIYGFDPTEGMPGWEKRLQRVHPEDRAKWQEVIERAIGKKSDYEMEYRILPPDGTVKYVHVVGHPVLDPSCEVLEFVGSSTDITERKQAGEALRRSEAYLAEAQRVTHTGSWASDGTTHEALYWSEEMFRIFGFDPQQGLPMRDQWLQRIHPEDRDRVKRQGEATG